MKKEEGVVTIPLRLLIVVAILVITVPLVLGIVSYYSSVSTEQQLISSVNYLRNQIRMVFSQGENTSIVSRVTFPLGTEFVKIGGPLNSSDSYLIKYKIRDGVERYTVVNYGDLGVRMTWDGKTLQIGSGTYDFIITKRLANFDIDHNGKLDDFYVNIEVRT